MFINLKGKKGLFARSPSRGRGGTHNHDTKRLYVKVKKPGLRRRNKGGERKDVGEGE